MKLNLPVLVLAAALPRAAAAENLELAGYLGTSFPGYSQSFLYSPGPVSVPIPGVSITQQGAFELNGSGGLVVSGGATFYVGELIGIEGRLDTVKVDIATRGARYDVQVTLPGIPLPVGATLDLGQGTVDLDSLKPWSLNLKLRTPGPARFAVSGGLSRLPSFNVSVRQTIGLGASLLNLIISNLEVSTVVLNGSLVPAEEGASRWGFNLGGGLQFKVGPNVALLVEGRYFHFKKQTYEWTVRPDRPLSSTEQMLYDATLERLDAIEFSPRFFQATAGIAVGF